MVPQFYCGTFRGIIARAFLGRLVSGSSTALYIVVASWQDTILFLFLATILYTKFMVRSREIDRIGSLHPSLCEVRIQRYIFCFLAAGLEASLSSSVSSVPPSLESLAACFARYPSISVLYRFMSSPAFSL